MSVAAIKGIRYVRPGVEVKGEIIPPAEIAKILKREIGIGRRLFSKIPFLRSASRLSEYHRRIFQSLERPAMYSKHMVSWEGTDDPACDMASGAVKSLLDHVKDKFGITSKQIYAIVVTGTTFNSNDPPGSSGVIDKLITDKVVPAEVITGDGKDGRTGWEVWNITEGCDGWVKMADLIDRFMKAKLFDGKFKKEDLQNPDGKRYVIGVAAANNELYMDGKNPHEILTYTNNAVATLFEVIEDNSGPLVFGDEKIFPNRRGKVTHHIREPKGLNSWGQYFRPNIAESKKEASRLRHSSPGYLLTLSKNNGFQISDFKKIIISQISEAVLRKVEIRLADEYRKELKLFPNIRQELKEVLLTLGINESAIKSDTEDELDSFIEDEVGEKEKKEGEIEGNICRYFYVLAKKLSDNDDLYATNEVISLLNFNEGQLLQYMIKLHKAIPRTKHENGGYSGVTDLPITLAQLIEKENVDLKKDSLIFVGMGLGKMEGMIMDHTNTSGVNHLTQMNSSELTQVDFNVPDLIKDEEPMVGIK